MAEPVFWLSFLVVAIPTLALLVAQVRASRRAFEIAASLLGLPPTAVSGTVFVRIKGLVRGFSVVGRQQSFGDRDSTTTIEVAGTGLIPPELLLAREGMGTSFGSLLAGKGISTGDERFDNTILIRGQPTLTLALLDHETRCRSADLVRKGGKLAGGTISLTVRGRLSDGGDLAGRVRDHAGPGRAPVAKRAGRRAPRCQRAERPGDRCAPRQHAGAHLDLPASGPRATTGPPRRPSRRFRAASPAPRLVSSACRTARRAALPRGRPRR